MAVVVVRDVPTSSSISAVHEGIRTFPAVLLMAVRHLLRWQYVWTKWPIKRVSCVSFLALYVLVQVVYSAVGCTGQSWSEGDAGVSEATRTVPVSHVMTIRNGRWSQNVIS